MTPCPICRKDLVALGEHLTKVHSVKNDEERRILIQLARGRIGIRKAPCPLPGCVHHKEHLQRHMLTHSELSMEDRLMWSARARTTEAMRRLAALRKTNPLVPMVTTLDQDHRNVDAVSVVPAVEKGLCLEPACVAYREHAQRLLNNRDTMILQRDLKIRKLQSLLRLHQRAATTLRVMVPEVRVCTRMPCDTFRCTFKKGLPGASLSLSLSLSLCLSV